MMADFLEGEGHLVPPKIKQLLLWILIQAYRPDSWITAQQIILQKQQLWVLVNTYRMEGIIAIPVRVISVVVNSWNVYLIKSQIWLNYIDLSEIKWANLYHYQVILNCTLKNFCSLLFWNFCFVYSLYILNQNVIS